MDIASHYLPPRGMYDISGLQRPASDDILHGPHAVVSVALDPPSRSKHV